MLRRAEEVRRRIFSSLPWHIRWAVVLAEISSDSSLIKALSRQLGAYMLAAGVEGMPEPGARWNPTSPKPEMTLPANYMLDFGHDLYGMTLSVRGSDPSLATDAIAKYLNKIWRGSVKLEPVALDSAKSYIRTGVFNMLRDIMRGLRGRGKNKPESLSVIDDNDETLQHDVMDPHAVREFEQLEDEDFLDELYDFLGHRVHPDIKRYLELRMDGVSKLDILGVPAQGIPSMLPHWHGSPQNWHNYQPKLEKAIREFYREKNIPMGLRPSEIAELV